MEVYDPEKKSTVLVTGANGFIGKNLVAALKQIPNVIVLTSVRETTKETLEAHLSCADVVYHLAGVNRPKNKSEFDENWKSAQQITDILKNIKKFPKIVFASSTSVETIHMLGEGCEYGVSKLRAELNFQNWANKTRGESSVHIHRLPNVFGKWCRPGYNSVIATWCDALINDKPIVINTKENPEINFFHIDNVVKCLIKEIYSPKARHVHIKSDFYKTHGRKIQLSRVYEILKNIHRDHSRSYYTTSTPFEIELYSTYCSYLHGIKLISDVPIKSDERGSLKELMKFSGATSQVFSSTTKPGVTRGGHYHNKKLEKFIVLSGTADIVLKNEGTGKTNTIQVTGKEMLIVNIPPGTSHWLKNVGNDELVTLFWTNEIFNEIHPDTWSAL